MVTFAPPTSFSAQANMQDPDIHAKAAADPDAFWAQRANELEWMQPWTQLKEWNPPHAKWFLGGKLNASANCIDRHLPEAADRPAILWEAEAGDQRRLTYGELHEAVQRAAAGLRAIGVEKGDRVTLYLPMVPELPIAMLACARIGAAHNVVFAGFSPTALAQRIEDAGSKVLITIDGYHRKGKVIPQRERTQDALAKVEVDHVVVVEHLGDGARDGDLAWDAFLAEPGTTFAPEPMDSEDMLFMMYTSGTTGKPKGIVHTTGGYLTGALTTSQWVLDLKPGDVYWCMADCGWITGHTYIVYGPLMAGATLVIFEGAPDYPNPSRPWQIIERYGVQVFYTAPTAIRSFMRHGDGPVAGHDLSSLRLMGSVGEPINPAAWQWYHEVIGQTRCPIVDTWWQTETGMMMATPLPAITPTKPGAAMRPFPGIRMAVLDESGNDVPAGATGMLAILDPWPSMLRTLWNDDARYVETYWSKWDAGTYFAGDGARFDSDGDLWVLGRMDDVMNVSGHRLSTAELESALVADPDVSEAAVVATDDELKGQVPVAFVCLRDDAEGSDAMLDRLMGRIVEDIGAIARPQRILIAPAFPKTRSGKIMRRILKAIVAGEDPGDTTTLEDPDVPAQLAELLTAPKA